MAICVGCGLEVNAGILEVQPNTSQGILCDAGGVRVRRSTDACNGLAIRANGLWSPNPRVLTGIATHNFSPPPPFGVIGPNNTYELISGITTITNNVSGANCCQMKGRVSVSTGGLWIEVAPGQAIEARGLISIGGGAFGAFPIQFDFLHNVTPNFQNMAISPFKDEFDLILSPGGSTTVQGMVRLFVYQGPPTLNSTLNGVAGNGVEIQWDLGMNCV